MADIAPFRAVRYAQPDPAQTAPPYDVLGPEERDVYTAAHPHNVVRLTLAASEEEAGRLYRQWLADGILAEEETPAAWAVRQDYTGPDGLARTRHGVLASLAVEPYETRVVLPHERTHAGPRESRLRLLRAARAQLEPIFLLHDGPPPVEPPARAPDLEAAGTSLWRLDGETLPGFFADRQLLIADGHHRYETALAYTAAEGTPESRRLMVVLVSTEDPGLEIFPTHRVFAGRPELVPAAPEWLDPADGVAALAREPYGRAVAVAYAAGRAALVRGEPGELDVELVDRYGHEGLAYTPDAAEARRRVDEGEADVAFLLRATRIEDVFARARRGDVMPQKTTYFYPKLVSGLLFHPA